MAVFLKINGQNITGRIDGLESFRTSLSLPEGDHTINQVVVSNELTFYDDGYDIINSFLLNNPAALGNYLTVDVFDDCCELQLPYKFLIRGDMCSWCEGYCHVTTRLIADDPDRQIVRNLQDTWIGDDRRGFFTNPTTNPDANYQLHPQIAYCNELRPDWLMDLIIMAIILNFFMYDFIAIFLSPFLFALITFVFAVCAFLLAVQAALNWIGQALSSLLGYINRILRGLHRLGILRHLTLLNINFPVFSFTPPACTTLVTNPWQYINDFKNWYNNMVEFLLGCGRRHPSPLVRGYIGNAATLAGCTGFVSSILTAPASKYFNLVHYAPLIKRGLKPNQNGVIISENLPNKSVMASDFLDYYAQMFNAKWWVFQGVLYFERKDFWITNPPMWDYTQDPDSLLEPICYSESSDRFFAASTVEYQRDTIDKTGTEAWEFYQYHINYGLTYGYNAAWKDCDKKEIMFGTPRFRDDGIERDSLTWWANNMPFIDNLIFGGAIGRSNSYLLMQHSSTLYPKPLIYDTNSPLTNALVQLKDPYQPQSINNRRNYWCEIDPNDTNTLFGFHNIDNPTVNPYKYYTGTAKVKLDCLTVATLSLRKNIIILRFNSAIAAEVTNIEIDWSKRMVEFTFKTS